MHVACWGDPNLLGGKDDNEEDTLLWHESQFIGTPSEYGRIHSIAGKVPLQTQRDALGKVREHYTGHNRSTKRETTYGRQVDKRNT